MVAVGTRMPSWVNQAYQEYAQRMPKVCQLELREVAAKKRGKNSDTTRILRDEASAISDATPANFISVALDRKGKLITTEQLAEYVQAWIDDSQDVAIVIGGPEGLDVDYQSRCRYKWSLSALTFAHPVVRVMLAEQLYRAWSINANLPYHRGD